MGTAEKRRRRAENRVFQDYTVAFRGARLPLKESNAAKAMLREFASPLGRFIEDDRMLYSVAIISWNVSLMPSDRREELVDEFLRPLADDDSKTSGFLKGVIDAMIERRTSLYPNEDVAFLPNPPEE